MITSRRKIAGTAYLAVPTSEDERVIYREADDAYLGLAVRLPRGAGWGTMDNRDHRTLADAARHLMTTYERRNRK